jgi:hypothetical protein
MDGGVSPAGRNTNGRSCPSKTKAMNDYFLETRSNRHGWGVLCSMPYESAQIRLAFSVGNPRWDSAGLPRKSGTGPRTNGRWRNGSSISRSTCRSVPLHCFTSSLMPWTPWRTRSISWAHGPRMGLDIAGWKGGDGVSLAPEVELGLNSASPPLRTPIHKPIFSLFRGNEAPRPG